jgi:hypothetical protein
MHQNPWDMEAMCNEKLELAIFARSHIFRLRLLHLASMFLIPLELTASLLLIKRCGYNLGRSLLPIASILLIP